MIDLLFELAAFLWFLECGPAPCPRMWGQPTPAVGGAAIVSPEAP